MAPTLKELLNEPFGPYWHDDILDATKCKSSAKKMLTLESVMIACGNEPIGLTETEGSQPECSEERLAQADVLVRGVLNVESYHWLTEYGRKVLQGDLNERNTQCRIDNPRMSALTLERLYNIRGTNEGGASSGRTVKVWIQGIKKKPAAHMTSDLVPYGLEIFLENKDNSHRIFHVLSMDVDTYAGSRRYLARYRLLKDLRDLLQLFKDRSNRPHVPLQELTPEWYVEQYLEYKAVTQDFCDLRVVHDSDDDSDIEPNTGGALKEGRSRRPRHVSSAEVRSLFAMHARWLIEDQRRVLHKKSRVIDVDSWSDWLKSCKQWQAKARKEDPAILFGVFDKDEESMSDQFDLEDVMSEDEPKEEEEERKEEARIPVKEEEEEAVDLAQPLRKSSRKRKREVLFEPSKTIKTARPRVESPVSDTPRTPSVPPRPISLRSNRNIVADDHSDSERSYDTDITDSEASTPPWSDSDDSLPSRSSTPPSPTLVARIPIQLRRCPELPRHGFTWYCQITPCRYEINLLSLTEEQRDSLTTEEVEFMTTDGWSLGDDLVQEIFLILVDRHYHVHLDDLGIELLEDDAGHVKLQWKTPEAHPSTHSALRLQRPSIVVKEEE